AGYASFLLGTPNTANVNAVKDPQWRKQAWSLYIQDTWKASRKLTLDYGLRWDWASQGHELYYRSSQVGINTPNPSAGGLLGGFVYEGYGPGRCNCTFTHAYPYAIGPRLGVAYQADSKTVLRGGVGIMYTALSNWWYVTGGSSTLGVGWNSATFTAPGYGQPAARLTDGLIFDPAELRRASYDPGIRPSKGQLDVPPAWGAQMNDPNGGRPGRTIQWNFAVQREIFSNMSLELAYVGNRSVWLEANALVNMNAIAPQTFQARGLDLTNAGDQTLLRATIGSSLAASRGFSPPYAGYPTWATVAQTLRPFPQFQDNLAVRWAPLGNGWYDSLQTKFTKRLSHGLDLSAAFTWQKELARGTGGNPSAGGGGINNVFNRANQKSLMGGSQPLILVIGANYETPRVGLNRIVREALGGWTFAGVLRYASGSLIGVPGSRNNLNQLTLQQSGTRFNRVEGGSVFMTKDPNCGCIDPNADTVLLNKDAWQDPAAGQWGYSASTYGDYRWQRIATEQLSLGRSFRLREGVSLQVRAEFFNAFNRLNLPAPSSGNPTQTPTYDSKG
ncbi:MAG TPA: TonB-dependent receptor, partial [Bryobacteraceae bacterium]|nr:TonB-dependent receptor [Bryobacteraceae bacterium]